MVAACGEVGVQVVVDCAEDGVEVVGACGGGRSGEEAVSQWEGAVECVFPVAADKAAGEQREVREVLEDVGEEVRRDRAWGERGADE